jgi:hypothetical protein
VRIGGSVPFGRGRLRRSGPPRSGTDRAAGHRKADASLDQSTRSSQSQIGWDHHLGRREAAQVDAVSALSVGIRWVPLVPVARGTRVARRARTTTLAPGGDGSELALTVRPALGDYCVVGKIPWGSRRSGEETRTLARP